MVFEETVSYREQEQKKKYYGLCRQQWDEDKICTTVQFGSVQYGISTLGKAHMSSTPSLRRVPNVAFEMAPVFV